MWESLLSTKYLEEYLSLSGIALTIVGFLITIYAAFKAKNAAEAAKASAEAAVGKMLKIEIISEIAGALQLIDELKRLHRSNAIEVIPDRYSGLRAKLIAIRECDLLCSDRDQTSIQDVITRVSALERALDLDKRYLEKATQLARANGSLSICTDVVISIKERVRHQVGATI